MHASRDAVDREVEARLLAEREIQSEFCVAEVESAGIFESQIAAELISAEQPSPLPRMRLKRSAAKTI